MINPIGEMSSSGTIELALDGAEDVSKLAEYAKKNRLKLGSRAIVAENSKVYMMQSSYEWVELGSTQG